MNQTRAQYRRGDAPAWHRDPVVACLASLFAVGLAGGAGLLAVLAGLHAVVVPLAMSAALALVVAAIVVGRYRGERHV